MHIVASIHMAFCRRLEQSNGKELKHEIVWSLPQPQGGCNPGSVCLTAELFALS